MTTIFIKTVIIYVILIVSMRLMGKRQIGELEVSDLVTTLLLSEIASAPITDNSVSILHAAIPILTLVIFEVVSSFLLVRFPSIKTIVSARPTVLIDKGVPKRREMLKVRLSVDELVSELRQQGVTDLSEVEYAILEQNGKITVIQKAEYKTPTIKDLGIKASESGISHVAVCEGKINKKTLERLSLKKSDIMAELSRQKVPLKNVYIMMIDDSGKVNIVRK